MPLLSSSSTLANISFALAISTVALAAPLLGIVHPISTLVVFMTSMLAFVVHFADRRIKKRPIYLDIFFAFPLILAAFSSMFHLLPLPAFLLKFFRPEQAEHIDFVRQTLAVTNQLSNSKELLALLPNTLSIDTAQSTLELCRLLSGLFVFYVLLSSCRKKKYLKWTYTILASSAICLLAITYTHKLFDIPLIWGQFRPSNNSFIYGPLVNPNHLARTFGAFALFSLGTATLTKNRSIQIFWGGVSFICAISLFLTMSRGGIFAFSLTVVLLTGVQLQQKHKKTAGILALSLFLGFFIILMAFPEQVFLEMNNLKSLSNNQKLQIYAPAYRLFKEHWLLGVGTGNFEAFLPHLVEIAELPARTFTHVENIVLQTIIDRGILFSLALFFWAGLFMKHLWKDATLRFSLIPASVLVFLLCGDFFDFFLEIGAGTQLAATALALLCAPLTHRKPVLTSQQLIQKKSFLLLPVLCALLYLPSAYQNNSYNQNQQLLALSTTENKQQKLLHFLQNTQAIRPYGAYTAYRLSAFYNQQSQTTAKSLDSAMKWANVAMFNAPNLGAAHRETARILIKKKHFKQAFLEYQLAFATGTLQQFKIIEEASHYARKLAPIMTLFPAKDEATYRFLCGLLFRQKRFTLAQECVVNYTNIHGKVDLSATVIQQKRQHKKHLSLLNIAGKQALKTAQWSKVESILQQVSIDSYDGHLQLLKVKLFKHQNSLQAAYQFSKKLPLKTPYSALLRWQLQAALSLEKLDEALSFLKKLKKNAASPRHRDAFAAQEISLYQKLRQGKEALKVAKNWSRRQPTSAHAWNTYIRLLIKYHFFQDAQTALKQLQKISKQDPHIPQYQKQIEQGLEGKRQERVRRSIEQLK